MTYHNSKTNVKIILLIILSKKSRLKHNTPLSKKDYKKTSLMFQVLTYYLAKSVINMSEVTVRI